MPLMNQSEIFTYTPSGPNTSMRVTMNMNRISHKLIPDEEELHLLNFLSPQKKEMKRDKDTHEEDIQISDTPPWARHAILLSTVTAAVVPELYSCAEYDKRDLREVIRNKIGLLSDQMQRDRLYLPTNEPSNSPQRMNDDSSMDLEESIYLSEWSTNVLESGIKNQASAQ